MLSGDSADAAKTQIIQGIIQQIIEESRDQLRLVEQQLKALRTAYPEVMASIRTRQVAQEMLLAKEAHIHELRSSGWPSHVPTNNLINFHCQQFNDQFTTIPKKRFTKKSVTISKMIAVQKAIHNFDNYK